MEQQPPPQPPTPPRPPPLWNNNNAIHTSALISPTNNNGSTTGTIPVRVSSPKRNTISYQQKCLLSPLPISIFMGSVYTIFTTYTRNILSDQSTSRNRNRNKNNNISSPKVTGSTILRQGCTSIGIVYVYYIMQCPMEAIQNKQSFVHNGIAGFTLSYIGLMREYIGVPFIPAYSLIHVPHLARNILGASIYGSIAMVVAAFYGHKPY